LLIESLHRRAKQDMQYFRKEEIILFQSSAFNSFASNYFLILYQPPRKLNTGKDVGRFKSCRPDKKYQFK
jgi:hypothetical protein